MVLRKRPQINEEFSHRCDDGFMGDQGRSASCGRYSNSACGTTIAITRKLSLKQLFLNAIKKRRVVLRKRPQINEEFSHRCDDGFIGDQGRSASCGRYSNSACGTTIAITRKLSFKQLFLNPHLLPFSIITYLRYRQISITPLKKRRVVLRKRPQINDEFPPRYDDGIMAQFSYIKNVKTLLYYQGRKIYMPCVEI